MLNQTTPINSMGRLFGHTGPELELAKCQVKGKRNSQRHLLDKIWPGLNPSLWPQTSWRVVVLGVTLRIIPLSKWLVGWYPPFISYFCHLEGEQPYLGRFGDLLVRWFLTTYNSWDDFSRYKKGPTKSVIVLDDSGDCFGVGPWY